MLHPRGSADGSRAFALFDEGAPLAEAFSGAKPDRASRGSHRRRNPRADLRSRLVAYACTMVGPAEAEDVAQETLLRLADTRAPLRDRDCAEAWTFRICRHAAIDLLRKRSVRGRHASPLPDGFDVWVSEEEGTEQPATEGRTAHSLTDGREVEWSSLSAHQRLLLGLHALGGISQPRLCARSGLSASALRVRLFRARRVLARGGAQIG